MKQENTPQRLQSLDALRGFDMLFIMGGSGLLAALAAFLPGSFFEGLAAQMSHVKWDGLAHHDTIFPLFLFIAGISFPFSLAKQRLNGRSDAQVYRKIVTRGLTLVLLGIIYNGFLSKFSFAEWNFGSQRYASVLARIGLAWMFAALLFVNTRWKTRAGIVGVVLVGYYLISAFVGAPDMPGADPLSREGCLEGYIDRLLLPGVPIYGDYDPEGLLSTLPAITTAMLGMLTGEWVKWEKEGLTPGRKVAGMVVAGVAMLAVGLLWSMVYPINKMLWSSTFVLVVGAYSVLMFALFYYIIDVRNHRRWTLFFVVIGMNSITIYLAQAFINFRYTSNKLFGCFINLFPENMRDFWGEAAFITVCWLFLYFLYKKKVFLKV